MLVHLVRKAVSRLLVQRLHHAAHSLPLVDIVYLVVEIADLLDGECHAGVIHVFRVAQCDCFVSGCGDGGLSHSKDAYRVSHRLYFALILAVAALCIYERFFQLAVDGFRPYGGNKILICHSLKLLLYFHVPMDFLIFS